MLTRHGLRGEYDRPLTPRERDVMSLLRLGWTNRQIADRLCITQQTVRNHVTNILRKLRARNRTHAVVITLTTGDEEDLL